ncbi:hypothetical protein [Nocardia kruczakiae]|uniref:hypothetical protein n=1 Tax=Nocardia kruczakiae TaxID=261477 RepID=UPI0007A50C78|nr:hypothetical protein [Nocardia kruczakiae]
MTKLGWPKYFRADFHVQWIDTEQANAVLPMLRTLFDREGMSTDGTLTPRDSDGRWRLDGVTAELDYAAFTERHGGGRGFEDYQFAVQDELVAEIRKLAPDAVLWMEWDYSDSWGHYCDGPDTCENCPGL